MKFIEILIVICLAAIAKSEESISNHVINGVDASILEHPYMAGIHVWFRNAWAPFCGSTIINRRNVLTVSCLEYTTETGNMYRVPAREVQVSIGSSYRLGTRGMFYTPMRLIRHPAYFQSADGIIADVAVVRLIFPIIFSPVARPISLGKSFVNSGEKVLVTGWGFVHPYDRTVATRMQKLEMSAMSNLRCWNMHRPLNATSWVSAEMVCLEANPGQGVCGGDSGGPIVLNNQVVGIACWTVRPCGVGPSVYVRVSEHYNWISANV